MTDLAHGIDRLAAETGFSGVVRMDRGDVTVVAKSYGLAHRGHRVANTLDTRFATASATKGLTALTIVSLIEEGRLALSTPARAVLGRDLPLIGDDVTVEQLLAHRSGIGDYVDEESHDYDSGAQPPTPVQQLASTEAYIPALEGHAPKFPAGARFSYCNSGYVVLALIAERSSGVPFHELVAERVCARAGMVDTGFFRSDELPDRTAVGYLSPEGLRTNVFHLPVRGSGDGGIYSTVADVHALWRAFFAGDIVSARWVQAMVRPRSDVRSESMRYGLGFWLHESQDTVMLEGADAGVSFRSVVRPASRLAHTVMSNTSDGAWPMTRHLDAVSDLP